jgi:hypothetical protein
VLGPAPLAAAGMSAISFGLTVGSAALPDDAPAERIAGASADELFGSLFDALRDVQAYVGREHDLMHSKLRQVASDVRELHTAGLLSPPRPRLADGVDGMSFHHVSSSHYR